MFLLLGILLGAATIWAFIAGHLLIAAGLFLITVATLGVSGLSHTDVPRS